MEIEKLVFELLNAKEEMKIIKIPKNYAKLLDTQKDECALFRIRKTYILDGSGIEYAKSFYRSDRYVFKFYLTKQ